MIRGWILTLVYLDECFFPNPRDSHVSPGQMRDFSQSQKLSLSWYGGLGT